MQPTQLSSNAANEDSIRDSHWRTTPFSQQPDESEVRGYHPQEIFRITRVAIEVRQLGISWCSAVAHRYAVVPTGSCSSARLCWSVRMGEFEIEPAY